MADQTTSMSAEDARLLALQASNDKTAIEEEIKSFLEVLRSQNATMTSPLVDNEGFPIASIDIVAIRNARARLIALRNDRDRLETRMRQLLDVALARRNDSGINGSASNQERQSVALQNGQHAQAMAHVPGTNGTLSMSVPIDQNADQQAWSEVGGLTPFARVNSVSPNSPAELADLRIGDLILKFGEMNGTMVHAIPANRDLINLPTVIQRGRELNITVLRNQNSDRQGNREVKVLRLTPMDGWGGRGLLGCHLLPV